MSMGLGRVDAPFTVGHRESIDLGSSGKLRTKPESKKPGLLVLQGRSKRNEPYILLFSRMTVNGSTSTSQWYCASGLCQVR
jgi:hypothetical protein